MENDIVKKFAKIAFINAVLGVCTIGVCPAFGIMALSVGFVLKRKNVEIDKESALKLKYANIMAIISLVFFVIDIVLLFAFKKYI